MVRGSGGGTALPTKEDYQYMATYMIAASDSLAASISRADYICDGTADDVQIQAAHDALPAVGGSIYLAEGTYNIATKVTFTKPVYLFGAGWATLVNASPNTPAFQFGNGTDRLNGCKVTNFRLVGNTGNNSHGLYFTKCDFLEVAEMWIRNWGAAGIKIADADENARIHDNNIDNLDTFSTEGREHGIYITGNTHDILIVNNNIEGWSTGIFADWIVPASAVINVTIADNNLDDCDDYGIHLEGALAVSITGNVIENQLESAGYSIFLDLTDIHQYSGSPWDYVTASIVGNHLSASEGGGVCIINGVGHTISQNVFQSIDGNPIKVSTTTSGNYDVGHTLLVTGNTVRLGDDMSGGRSERIDIQMDGLVFTDNNLHEMNLEALVYVGDDAVISSNRMYGCNQAGTQDEIVSIAGSRNSVMGNTIRGGTVTKSIQEEAGSDYNVFVGNVTDDGIGTVGANSVAANNVTT